MNTYDYLFKDHPLYSDRLNLSLFEQTKQSQIEANFVRAPSEEHHCQIGKGDEEDRFGEVAVVQKGTHSTDPSITKKRVVSALLFLCALLGNTPLNANVYYEGTNTFRSHGKVDLSWMQQLLPYNPVFIDIGAYYGGDTCRTSKIWPKSTVYAFEPNPRAFEVLEKTIDELGLSNIKTYNLAVSHYNGWATLYLSHGPRGDDLSYEHQSSLLPPSATMAIEYQGSHIAVPCVVLDDWCQQNQIGYVDVLRVETEGLELQILQSSPNILKTAKVIIVQSFFSPLRRDMTDYFGLKALLVKSGFVPLAHWYTQNLRGLAVYVSNELFDAYFVHCLGLGSGGISYP